jgi:CheY-like chemotaxis protein
VANCLERSYTSYVVAVSTRKVLVVDDGHVELTVNEALRGLDDRLDVVVEKKDASSALRTLGVAMFDLIIIDNILPRQFRLQLLNRLARTTPILMMLTAAQRDPIEGITEVMPSVEALREACLRVLGRGRTSSPADPLPVAADDVALSRALSAREKFASAVKSAVDEHHRAGRDVVVQRDGTLVRVAPPRT